MPAADASLATRLIEWQLQAGRHDLPWQGQSDPYRVWVSEIMLQQTQVATVLPYYRRFLDAFPDVGSLARASEEEVLQQWSGLGYYARARNLHRCAREVVARFAGRFPSQPDALAGLPGIGRSSAAAIAVFSYGVRAAILDGNVRRVLCRHFGMEGDPSRAATQRELWAIAERELPHESIVAYTQGLMDLGATVCTRSSPDCSRCPLASTCVALRDDAVDRLPTTRARAPLPIRAQSLLLVRSGSRLLLERRPSSGLWGGLWCPPVVDGPALEHLAPTSVSVVSLPPGILNALAAIGVELSSVATAAPLETFQHVFTHFRLHAQPWLIDLCDHGLVATDSSQRWRWHRLDDLSGAALPKPIKVLLAGIGPGRGAKQT